MIRFSAAHAPKLLIAFGTISALVASARPAHATFYSVWNGTPDSLLSDNTCSFREAMMAASRKQQVDACPAGTDDNEINITGDPAFEMVLNLDDPIEVTNYTNISCDFGPGWYQQIIGNDTRFIVHDGGIFDVSGIHFRRFNSPPFEVQVNVIPGRGGVRSQLNLQYVELSENTTPNSLKGWQTLGIYNPGGVVNLYNVSIHDNDLGPKGGGILNIGGIVTIYNSAIYNNKVSQYGGAIHNSSGGTVYLADSTLSGNSAGMTAQGSTSAGEGGAIYNASGTVDVVWSTVAYNTARKTAGGIFNAPSANMHVKRSIVSDNRTLNGGQQCAGTITSQGYNLLQTCTSTNGTGDVRGLSAALAPLVIPNGDQWTLPPWHTPSATSPAVNAIPAGTEECSASFAPDDQIFHHRFIGGKCDIGAIERQ